ncbi:MAG: valine--tRNA ligase [Christensenellaceae bacterium]|jgi:valyl-tRNA synthetase|nr:valine--tRNA ligase [Christensenellaceae bacterium]
MELPKNYNPSEFESTIYKKWEASKCFTPEPTTEKSPFCIVIPPPNITGQLHIGHALNNTMQDIIIRHKRMQGFAALWLPGTDHASIATEAKIVDALKTNGQTKKDIGRTEFLKLAFEWKEKYGGKIVLQLRRLGCSCDWTREQFTMNDTCSRAVNDVFVKLYRKKLIYRGNRMINWCPNCKTALSDAEVEYSQKAGHMWYIKYPFENNTGYLTVATTRPETMFGDTAVAINPEDPNLSKFIGESVKLPLTDKVIKVIGDTYVEIGFGTGAVKITPGHDPNDFEVGLRHNLPIITVMNEDGTMNELAYFCAGDDRFVARKKVISALTEQGLLEKCEDYSHNVGECQRCGTVAEPRVSTQWFVKMSPLAKPAIKVVKDRRIVFIPDRFQHIYFNWMNNIRDWCISRQLWWGHQIPAWYCESCGHITVETKTPSKCASCGSTILKRDEDVLDTWFSSALWPFSTLGYPKMTKDLKYFYPTNVLVTAYDIIFFWVARMIFSGLAHMGEIPFPEVLIHGLVRDSEGKKMSKSAGNGIDPIDLIDRYGADALRVSLITGMAPGSDIRFGEEKMEPSRNFLNKLWNASRYVLANIKDTTIIDLADLKLTTAEKWILHKMNKTISEVNGNLRKYELGLGYAKIYDFIWTDLCDWYIEISKPSLYGSDVKMHDQTISVLVYVLKAALKLLHPFAPFITEQIWNEIRDDQDSKFLAVAKFPSSNTKFSFSKDYKRFENIKGIIRALRNARAEYALPPSKTVKIYIQTLDKSYIKKNLSHIYKLAHVTSAEFVTDKSQIKEKTISITLDNNEILIPLGDLVDIKKELERLNKEISKVTLEVNRGQNILANEGFISKAPKQLIAIETEKLNANTELLTKLQAKYSEITDKNSGL